MKNIKSCVVHIKIKSYNGYTEKIDKLPIFKNIHHENNEKCHFDKSKNMNHVNDVSNHL